MFFYRRSIGKTKAPKLSDKEERNVTSRIFRVSVYCRCSPAGMWYETESLNIIGSLFYIEYYVDNSAVRVRRRTITQCIVELSCQICETERGEVYTRRKVHLMRRKSEVRLTMALLRLGGGSVSD